MIVDESLLEAVAKQKKYTFISTGMSSTIVLIYVKIFRDNNCEFEPCNVFQLTHLDEQPIKFD